MRVCFTNLGCKLNQAELEGYAQQFHAAGYRVVPSVAEAELHVINTCTVTHLAARSSRKAARRGGRRNPDLRTVLTGCWATEEPAEAARLAGVDLVVTNDRKERLLELVREFFPARTEPQDEVSAEAPDLGIPYVPLAFGNTRALVKVEDGCNMSCAFCIIPSTRGRQRSRPVEACLEEVRRWVAGGYREVVVTGVQISSYRDVSGVGPESRLYDLVRRLLAETSVERLRLTSIAPWQLDPRLLDLWGDPRLCRHLHFSLQSGSTETLRRMRRPYSAERYREVVEQVRRAIPGVAVTTDVIVGFPGETGAEFSQSLAFVEEMAFAKVHVFPYSVRRGTGAAELGGQVDHHLKKERAERMGTVARAGERAFWRGALGRTEGVLWETRKNGVWQGLTDNYVRVLAASNADLANRLVPTRLASLAPQGVFGEPMAVEAGAA